MYISYQIEIQCMRYASCTITWKFKYIPYPDLLTDLSEKYIRLVVHILVLIHRVRVSDSGTNYSKFSQEAVKRGVHSLHKEVPLWLGIVDGINNSTHCILLCPTPPSLLGAELILNGFRPSDGIQFAMAKKQNPEILCCAPREVAEPILNGFRLHMESNLSWQKSRTQKFWVVPL